MTSSNKKTSVASTKIALIVLSSLFISSLSIASGAPDGSVEITAENLDAARSALVRILNGKDYFKNGTCTDVLNTALLGLGLPEVGSHRGTGKNRLSFDRSREQRALPQLFDTMASSPTNAVDRGIASVSPSLLEPTYVTRLEAAPSRPNEWQLHFKHFNGNVKPTSKTLADLETVITFAAVPGRRGMSCEMIDTKFVLKGSGEPSQRSVSTQNCLDAFLIETPKASSVEDQLTRWVKADCSFALHYSREAKRLIAGKGEP